MQNSLVNILTEARDSLTPETWRKRRLFQLENNTICMCAHGAVQNIVNPKVKPYLEKLDLNNAVKCVAPAAGAAYDRGENDVKYNPYKSLLRIWNERPSYIKEDYGYGTVDIHYLLGMVGLTIGFNDLPNTTLEMVKEKFNQAIELAKLIENQNNG